VFATEIKNLHHLQTMQLHHLQLNWKTDKKAMSLKQAISAMLRENIASLRYPSGVVEFVQSPKRRTYGGLIEDDRHRWREIPTNFLV
jgi:hypothetical protein